jgi:membrane protein implicated in regulation of membrane protease activity
MFITLVFLVVFLVLVAIAICETIYGLILITYGILCHVLAAILYSIHLMIVYYRRLRRKFKSQKKPIRQRAAFRRPTTTQSDLVC